jgi:hypothetical protein
VFNEMSDFSDATTGMRLDTQRDTVMLVDDDELSLGLAAAILGDQTFQIEVHSSGESAWARAWGGNACGTLWAWPTTFCGTSSALVNWPRSSLPSQALGPRFVGATPNSAVEAGIVLGACPQYLAAWTQDLAHH